MTLPLVINPGDTGHIGDHEEIDELLSRLADQTDFLATGIYTDLAAARPAAAADNLGLIFAATNSGALTYSDGSAWHDNFAPEADTFFGSGRPWFDVRSRLFGAKADGSDDYAEIQSAITAAEATEVASGLADDNVFTGGGVVYFPYGGYKIDTGLVVSKPNITLVGERGAQIYTESAITMVSFLGDNTGAGPGWIVRSGIRGLQLDGRDAAVGGVEFEFSVENVLVDCLIYRCTGGAGIGVKLTGGVADGAFVSRFIDCAIRRNNIGVQLGNQSNNIVIRDCRIQHNNAEGIATEAGKTMAQVTITGCDIEGNGGAGIKFNLGNLYAITVNACYFEGNGSTANIVGVLNATLFLSITGCHFNGGTYPYEIHTGDNLFTSGNTFLLTANPPLIGAGVLRAVHQFDEVGSSGGTALSIRGFDAASKSAGIELICSAGAGGAGAHWAVTAGAAGISNDYFAIHHLTSGNQMLVLQHPADVGAGETAMILYANGALQFVKYFNDGSGHNVLYF